MKKAILILNPKSGLREGQTQFFAIVNELTKKYELTVHITRSSSDVINTAEKCGFENIIVCGGDGTLSLTLDGVMRRKKALSDSGAPAPDINIGYIPCGTANDVAQTLCIPRKPIDAAKKICTGKPTPHDVCTFNGRYYVYTASFGTFTKASYETPQEAKNVFGNFAYFFGGIGEFLNMQALEATIEWEGGTLEESEIAFCATGNTRSIGGRFVKFPAELAALNDGKLEMLIVRKPKNVLEINKTVQEILSGTFNNEFVTLLHSPYYKITMPDEILWTIDGEGLTAPKTVEIGCIKSGFKLIL